MASSVGPDQTARRRKLIWDRLDRKSHKVPFRSWGPIYERHVPFEYQQVMRDVSLPFMNVDQTNVNREMWKVKRTGRLNQQYSY